jgi:hypothetical protein
MAATRATVKDMRRGINDKAINFTRIFLFPFHFYFMACIQEISTVVGMSYKILKECLESFDRKILKMKQVEKVVV